ncbi:MAG: response regulator transcription factor [Clostridia bacterium]|nr:response regulator transcription factor [Clostridia bacterium]
MLNFVLCDDSIPSLKRLSKMLESIFIKNNIEAEIGYLASNPHDALEYIRNNKVDVLFLDINLNSNLTGCDMANLVRKNNKNIYIIFLTGHLEYALLAYKYKTFDYLPKPIVDERLEETVLRLIEDINLETSQFIKINNNRTIINANDINYIKKDGMKLVFCTNKENYETYSSFSKFEPCLPGNFVRCHKSYIVNINNVKKFNFNENIIELKNNCSCTIGAKYKTNFMEVFKNGNFTNNLECVIN